VTREKFAELLITLIAIGLIAMLEILAILNNIDGKTLALALALIALLAPSPISVIRLGRWFEIKKAGGQKNGAVSERPN